MKNHIFIPLLTQVSISGKDAKARLQRIVGNFWDELQPVVSWDTPQTYQRNWKIASEWFEISGRLERGNPQILLTVGIGVAPANYGGEFATWPVVEASELKRMLQTVARYNPSSPEKQHSPEVASALAEAIAFIETEIDKVSERNKMQKDNFFAKLFNNSFVPKVAMVKSSIGIQMLLLEK